MNTKRFNSEADAHLEAAQHPGATVRKNRGQGGGWSVIMPDPAVAALNALTEAMRPQHAKPAPLDVWSLGADIMTCVIPPQEYALRPYLPLECATGLAGQGKVGKSFLALAIMLHVAAGRPFLGCEVKQGHVWYFSAEDKPNRVKERARSILKDFTEEERGSVDRYFHCIDAVGKRLFFVATVHGAPQITSVCEQIAETVGKAVLVVVDTVSRINPLPENSNEGMALVVSAAEVIASRTGAAVLLNHHVGKSQARSGETDMYAGRGASSFGDNCRSVLALTHATEAHVRAFDERAREQQRLNNVRLLTHSASSYGREAPPAYLLRREDGTFEKLNPVTDLLTPLAEWLNTKKLATFTRFGITRTHAKEIWNPTPSRLELEKFVDHAVATEVFLRAEPGQGGGERYKLSPATADTIQYFDERVVTDLENQQEDDAWLN
jgi:hypothetical protein